MTVPGNDALQIKTSGVILRGEGQGSDGTILKTSVEKNIRLSPQGLENPPMVKVIKQISLMHMLVPAGLDFTWNHLNIECTEQMIDPEIALYDITDRMVYNVISHSTGKFGIRLNTGNYRPGHYILQIKAGGNVTSKKILIE